MAAVLFGGLIWLAGARDFLSGFAYSFILWIVVKLYVNIVLHCGWFAHCEKAWLPGTEDMKASYQNYEFYLKSIPRSLLFGALSAAIIGAVINLT